MSFNPDPLDAESWAAPLLNSSVPVEIDGWAFAIGLYEMEPEASELNGEASECGLEGGAGAIGVGVGSALLIRTRSSIHRYTAPETPSSTLNRSSIASLVTLSIKDNCSSVKVGGSWDMGALG